jgi:hypothetical protein
MRCAVFFFIKMSCAKIISPTQKPADARLLVEATTAAADPSGTVRRVPSPARRCVPHHHSTAAAAAERGGGCVLACFRGRLGLAVAARRWSGAGQGDNTYYTGERLYLCGCRKEASFRWCAWAVGFY